MKYFVVFSLIICFCSAALAENYVRDVPDGHWAAEAVYELVRMGVTRGYPDGTFRGKKNISRYEIATLLSKLVRYFNRRQGIDEKLIEELKAEMALIKHKKDKAAKETRFSGQIESRSRVSTIVPRGGKTDYRLKLSLVKEFDENTSLKFGLDTVDAGFNSEVDRKFATELIDIESRFKLAGLNFKVNLGPGVVPHVDEFFPCENNTIYIRPKTAVKASTKIGKMSVSGSYVTRQVETSGKIGVHELTGKLKYKFGDLAVYFQPRYLFEIDGARDILADVGVNFILNKNWITYLLLSAGDFQAGRSGIYLKVVEKIIDPWKTGTNVVLRFDKVGSKYRRDDLDPYEFIYLNNFDRLILDGMVNIGLKIDQKLMDKLSMEWKGDYVTTGDYKYGEAYPETYFIWQLDLTYKLSSKIGLNAFYRSYNVPSGMAQFSDPVPKVSDLIGAGVKCGF